MAVCQFTCVDTLKLVVYLKYLPISSKFHIWQGAQLPIFFYIILYFLSLSIKTYNFLYFAKIPINSYILEIW